MAQGTNGGLALTLEFVFKDVVRIYDTDAQGIAHYASYYRFFTNTIERFMKDKVGIPYPNVNDELWFVIVETHAEYKRPLRVGDVITVTISPQRLSEKVIRFQFQILKEGEVTTTGYVDQVAINPKIWKAVNIPEEILKRILNL
ncbi:MAG: thioesterase family protein [Metallosphaera yellowstonensis]|uniref:Putative thioesterase n=1 Tax=Metallosphaera yellowstonensis MK1 TaxID=671065 RepID=H2C0P5_9CREN|nr:thioesterase family protein [Metallosphaera yellowstonensis]EHP71307.1 putative thioesterase [Metallosphaera yellowstonensis MK1]